MGTPRGRRDRRVLARLVPLVRSEEKPSCWGLARHFGRCTEDSERCGLYEPYGRAQY